MIVNPGIRRFLGSAIQRLFNSASVSLPLTHTAIPTRGDITPSFTRATTSTWPNNDGYLVTGVAGEIGFVGARRVRNRGTATENLVAGVGNWQLNVNATAATGVSDPRGGTAATTVTATGATGQFYCNIGAIAASLNAVVGNTYVNSMYVRRRTGTGTVNGITINNTRVDITSSISSSWARITFPAIVATGTSAYIGVELITSGDAVDIAFPQQEDVTAQTTQTAGEYVSVGVESAPYYHGSMVDGVKCFPTDRSGNPITTTTTYDAVTLNGVAGTYVSTPDSVASSITGDIDIRAKAAPVGWTGAGVQHLVSKRNNATGASEAYAFAIQGSGVLSFYHNNGATQTIPVSTVGTGFSAGTTNWVRVTWKQSTGYVNFYTSSDGVTWSQLGAADVVGPTTALNDGTRSIALGQNPNSTEVTFSGKIYQAQIYNGINGTLAVDFNASRYAGGTTLTGSTGETWTLQGNAVIHPTNYPLVGYVPWEARTNLLLQSAVVATQSITVAAVAHTLSFKGTGTITLSGVSAAGPLVGTGANDRVTLTFTPTAGSLTLTVSGSCTVGQLEAGSFATPYQPTTTVAVARNADVDQYPTTAGPIAAVGTVYLDFTPYHAPSGTIALWGTYVDASNYTAILHDATNLIFRKRIAGSNYDATIANAFASGTTYKVAATWGAAGTAIYLDGVAGTPHANTTAAQIAATMQVGADGNSLQQPGAGTTNLRIWQRQLSAPEGVAVTA